MAESYKVASGGNKVDGSICLYTNVVIFFTNDQWEGVLNEGWIPELQNREYQLGISWLAQDP